MTLFKKKINKCMILIYFVTIFMNSFYFYNIFITKNNNLAQILYILRHTYVQCVFYLFHCAI